MLMAGGKALTANEPHIDSPVRKIPNLCGAGGKPGRSGGRRNLCFYPKISEGTLTPAELVQGGTVSREMDDFFGRYASLQLYYCRCHQLREDNYPDGAASVFSPETRIITIEDSPELMLRRRSSYREYHNIVALQAKDHEIRKAF